AFELHPEHRARERLDDLAFDLDFFFLDRHNPLVDARTAKPRAAAYRSKGAPAAVRIRGAPSVIATVCSKWAASDRSSVEIDHSSLCSTMSGPPAVIIGSIASVMPSVSLGPRPGAPKFGSCGSSWYSRPTPWPTSARTTEKPFPSTTVWIAWLMSERWLPA